MEPERGRRQLICYNCGGLGHYVRDCSNPTIISCPYCEKFDHEMVDCPMLIPQMCEKGVLQPNPTQNVQRMRLEPREEDPSINMVLRSNATTGGYVRKQLGDNGKGCDAPTRELDLEIEQVRGTSKEAQKSFTEVSALGNRDPIESGMDPFVLTTFLETCMKLLRDKKAMNGLQEPINKCAGNTLGEFHVVQNIGKHKTRIGREMRLTAQIGEYEMDHVILD